MANTQYALHLKGFVGGADFDRNYVGYVLARHVSEPINVLIDEVALLAKIPRLVFRLVIDGLSGCRLRCRASPPIAPLPPTQ